MILGTGFDVWTQLCTRGGIDTARYDSDLEKELARSLGLRTGRPLRVSLEQSDISATEFVVGFLRIARPFALMVRDILSVADRIAATQARDNLKIRFDFGAAGSLDVDLEVFRLQVNVAMSVLRPVRFERWDLSRFWDLWHVLGGVEEGSSPSALAGHPVLDGWIADHDSGVWPTAALPAPESGDPRLDTLLERVVVLHSAVVDAARNIGPRRRDLEVHSFPGRDYGLEISDGQVVVDDAAPGFLRFLHSDHWSRSVATRVYACAEFARSDPSRIQVLVDALTSVLDSPPATERTREDVIGGLSDLLQLPIWRLRYELYSV